MATRCNIVVKCNGKFITQIYHHYDGGFNYVGNELCEVLESFSSDKVLLEDIAEDFCNYLNSWNSEYEIEDYVLSENLHGDIEYVYYIDFIIKEDNILDIKLIGKCLYNSEIMKYTLDNKKFII